MYREAFSDCQCLTVIVKSTIKVTDVTMLISPDEDDSWEPISHLSAGAKKLVSAFNAMLRRAL